MIASGVMASERAAAIFIHIIIVFTPLGYKINEYYVIKLYPFIKVTRLGTQIRMKHRKYLLRPSPNPR